MRSSYGLEYERKFCHALDLLFEGQGDDESGDGNEAYTRLSGYVAAFYSMVVGHRICET